VAFWFPYSEDHLAIAILIGALISALLGLWTIDFLERKAKVKNDAALCFVLAVFFGIGVLIASRIQITHALWYKQIQIFLYGQAATMTNVHVLIYAVLAVVVVIALFVLYRPLQMINFDRIFANSLGVRSHLIDAIFFILLALAVVIGIRSVGVVLMSGMLIAPAVAARQFTHRLSHLFGIAGFFGTISGFLGNYFSVQIPLWVASQTKFSLPTGPMILLIAAGFSFLSLLLAPRYGFLSRLLRIFRFRGRCIQENVLKFFWKQGVDAQVSTSCIAAKHPFPLWTLKWVLLRLMIKGLIEKVDRNKYRLTLEGELRAARIVRLHRLWEVYLVSYLGQGAEKVHRNAEEMEHIINSELERELTELLQDPKEDPHRQPIPAKDGIV
jgi:manganese/zinc/iron transport system permease protein